MWIRIQILASNKGSNPWRSAQIDSYFIHFGLSSANWCGCGSASGSSFITLMQLQIRFLFNADPDFYLRRIRTRIKVTKMMRIHIHNTDFLDLYYLNPNLSPGPGFLLSKICKKLTVSGSRPKDPTHSLPNIKYRVHVSPGTGFRLLLLSTHLSMLLGRTLRPIACSCRSKTNGAKERSIFQERTWRMWDWTLVGSVFVSDVIRRFLNFLLFSNIHWNLSSILI